MTDWMAAAERAAAVATEHATEGDELRRLPAPVVEALKDEGVLRMCVPGVYGGPEVAPPTMLQVIERVARADGAAGWCVMIASTTSLLSHYVEPHRAREIWGDPRHVTGGVFARNGVATKVDGGYRVTGRWLWGSGTQHCDWITGGAAGDGYNGSMWFTPDQVEFHDTWHTSGLRGTGSLEYSVDDVYVPDDLASQPQVTGPLADSPLGAFPDMTLLAVGVAAAGLGIGRHALDAIVELGTEKKPQFSSRTISQSGVAQAELARAEATLRSARAFLLDEVSQAWDVAVAGGKVDVAARARMRLAGANAAEAAVKAADVAYTLGGGTSIFEHSPLQRCLRDAHVVTQHIMVAPRLYETLGKLHFGIDIDATMI
ncbi:MAG: acyl-CoA dehydrogenase family protein [Actinobacteria bacterium]|nr:acyl-CoA dehydrogenase family protein [Actinomycetota bacterium]